MKTLKVTHDTIVYNSHFVRKEIISNNYLLLFLLGELDGGPRFDDIEISGVCSWDDCLSRPTDALGSAKLSALVS